jgi:hypothetical protein
VLGHRGAGQDAGPRVVADEDVGQQDGQPRDLVVVEPAAVHVPLERLPDDRPRRRLHPALTARQPADPLERTGDLRLDARTRDGIEGCRERRTIGMDDKAGERRGRRGTGGAGVERQALGRAATRVVAEQVPVPTVVDAQDVDDRQAAPREFAAHRVGQR